MSQNETLREALLEIEILRAREQEALRETRALLDILRITTSGSEPLEALRAALDRTAEVLRAECVFIGRVEPWGLAVETAIAKEMRGGRIEVAPSFFMKPRNVLDAGQVRKLDGWAKSSPVPFKSVLTSPLSKRAGVVCALVCLHSQPQAFSNKSLGLLNRLIQLTSQALNTLELSSQNALLAAVIDGSSSGFAIADATDPELPLVFVNKAFELLTGYSSADVLGENCRFLSAEAKDSPERVKLREALRDKRAGRFLVRNAKKNGDFFWNNLALYPVVGEGGKTSHIVATQTDATERVLAEDDTRLARARLRDVLDHTNDAFVMVTADGQIAFCNDSTRAMFPAPKTDWQAGTDFSENWAEFMATVPATDRSFAPELLSPDLDRLCDHTHSVRTSFPDGRQVLVRAQKTEDASVVVSATDTTAIRETERLLRQRAAAVENANNGIGILDERGRITYANSALARFLGYAKDTDAIGRAWRPHYIIPERFEQLRAEFGLAENAEILQLKSGDAHKTYHEMTVTHVEKVGEVLVARDVSAAVRNRSRLAELNAQVEDARRHEALSSLAAGLAHDFNNVLSAISGSAALISTDLDANGEVKSHAERITKAGAMAARLVNRMLDLSSADDDASIFDLRAVLGELRALAEVNLSGDTSFIMTSGDEALQIRAAISDISLVILNLVLNARDALDAGRGVIELRVDRFESQSRRTPLVGKTLPRRDYASITVCDTGIGIPDDVLPKIMNSFFTTKGHRGTGAGLAMVAAIVKRLDGAVFVESTLGEGTTIEIALPLIPERDDTDTELASRVDLSGTSVMVLDDQLEVAETTAAFLSSCGAEVSVLDDPALAVEVVLEASQDWTALVTDYDMPVMSGGDVIEAIHRDAPEFPLFLVTALARRISDTRINDATVRGVFAKPVNLGQLARALAEVK